MDHIEKKKTSVFMKHSSRRNSSSYDVLVNDGRRESRSAGSPICIESGPSIDDGNESYIVSKKRLVVLNFAWLGLMITLMVILIAAIPAQISYLVGPEKKTSTLALLAVVCAAVIVFTAPMFGYLSDNCRSKFGRRRLFMICGTAIMCVGLGMASFVVPRFSKLQELLPGVQDTAKDMHCHVTKPRCPLANVTSDRLLMLSVDYSGKSVALYALSVAVFFFGNTMMTAAYTGLIADKTHPSARGFSSGVVGVMMLTGNLAGAGLGMIADDLQVPATFGILCVVCILSTAVTCIFTPEVPTNRAAPTKTTMSIKDLLCGYIRPLKKSDFRWVFITRFLLQMGLASSVGFLEYWLDDAVQLPGCMKPIRAVSLLFIPFMIAGALSSGVCGILTDKYKRRKMFVYISGITMSLCVIVLMFIRIYWLAILTMVILGVGYGAYVAVDLAMVFDVLPNASERAKDLAVWNLAMILPQVVATPIGGIVVHSVQAMPVGSSEGCTYALGYTVLFGITAFYFLLSVAFVNKIKGVA